ncbi:MAG: diguanylate cyclase [Candidatus Sericytochromatia bacterium]
MIIHENDWQTVLIIDDSKLIHYLTGIGLRPEGVVLLHAYDGITGMQMVKEFKPDLILLDLNMPGQSGLEFCRQLKDDPEFNAIPVIFLTATADVATKVQAFDAGAIDYVTKPFDTVELRARVRAALRTKLYLDLLSTRAQLDGLTRLWNRSHFDQRLADEIAVSQRHCRPVSLIMLDIDHFKKLNDVHGHPFGDQVLRQVAKVLNTSMRQTEIACRYGGEEFAIILRETDLTGAERAGERIRVLIEALEFENEGKPVTVTASVGASSNEVLANPQHFSPEDLISSADKALYFAKHGGRNRVCRADHNIWAGEV